MILEKKILIVDNEPMTRWMLGQTLREWSYVPFDASNLTSAVRLFDNERPTLTILDINLPNDMGLEFLRTIKLRHPNSKVLITSSDALDENAVAGLQAGACGFINKPIDLGSLQNLLSKCFDSEEASPESPSVELTANFNFRGIIGESEQMKDLISLARKVAHSDVSSVLLQGESGTGKDMIAKAVHYSSARAAKPFVAINCAAIPSNLIESELFGHEKGSFTDAKTLKQGLFEQARGGTIFLDEIGELEFGLQAKLLRVLEENTFRRVGGLRDLPLNACVIAASNRNLREESDSGKFRHDLYFRLSVIEITVPPLRMRGDDVLLLARHFIRTLDRRNQFQSMPRQLAPETVEAFRQYHWGGNVRELRNVIERALILEDEERITLKYLPPELRNFHSNGHSVTRDEFHIQLPSEGISLEAVEDSLIEQAMQRSHGNITRACELLNISRDQLRYRLKKKRSEESN